MEPSEITKEIAKINFKLQRMNRERIAVERKRTDLLVRRDALYLGMAQPKHQVSPLEANNCLRVPGTLPVECAEIDTRHWENVS